MSNDLSGCYLYRGNILFNNWSGEEVRESVRLMLHAIERDVKESYCKNGQRVNTIRGTILNDLDCQKFLSFEFKGDVVAKVVYGSEGMKYFLVDPEKTPSKRAPLILEEMKRTSERLARILEGSA